MRWNQAKCYLLVFDFIGVLVMSSKLSFYAQAFETSSSNGLILNATNIVAILR